MLVAADEKSSGDLNGLYINRMTNFFFFLKENVGLPKGAENIELCEHI